MYLTASVTKWQSLKDSCRRIAPIDKGTREFILNPSKMSEITALTNGSRLYLSDRYKDRRESSNLLEITETPAQIIAAMDVAMSETITLPVYRNNDPTKSTYNITIPSDALIFADRYNQSPLDVSWVAIEEAAFKIRDGIALVALSVEDILTGASLLKDYDGNGYTTVTIGSQEWIVENFRVKHYSDGTAIPEITGDVLWLADTDGAYCYYENDEDNFDFIGLLYNNYATTNVHGLAYLERGGVQELGWRVPTETDMLALVGAVGGVNQCGTLKEIGTVHWDSPNTNATDAYGFKWISGGNRYIDVLPVPPYTNNGFSNQGNFGDLWTTTADPLDPTLAEGFYLSANSGDMHTTTTGKVTGQNVRLVRDV